MQIKAPKLYFYDTALACYVLRIANAEQLETHYLRGGLVELMILSELVKKFYNHGKEPSIYYWRTSRMNEVDCLLDYGQSVIPVEIKASATFKARFFDGIAYWCSQAGVDQSIGYVVYGGQERHQMKSGTLVGWREAATVVNID